MELAAHLGRIVLEPLAGRLGRLFGGERRCLACGMLCRDGQEGAALCGACAKDLALRAGGFCPKCGEMYARAAEQPHLCGRCLVEPRDWGGFALYGKYGGVLAELVKEFKFRQGLERTRLLQELACRAFEFHGLPVPDVIVPVPLHDRRLVLRGFNQSLELVRLLGKRLGRPVNPDGIVRMRDTVPQSTLSGKRRLVNLKDAFRADPAVVMGRRVLLADDVMTTGATLDECARGLYAAGAEAVDVLVLARA